MPPDMPYARISPEGMAELHPMLFRASQPKPSATFSEQHAFALAARTNSTDSASKTFTQGATT